MSLENLPTKIDQIDNQLLDLLSKRMEISQEVGIHKKENNIPVLQLGRWKELLQRTIQKGSERNLSEEFVTEFMKAIYQESIRNQALVLKEMELN